MKKSELTDSAFENLVERYLDEFMRVHPHEATFLGFHEYDGELDHIDTATRNEFLKKEEELIRVLSEFKQTGSLSPDNMLDLEILLRNLQKDVVDHDSFNRYLRDPSVAIDICIFACMILLMRDFAPREQRYQSLISRLKQIPRLLIEAKDNLQGADSIPPVWLNIATEKASSAQRFFSEVILQVSGEIAPLKNDLLAGATLASKAFIDYQDFLENELSAKSQGDFASGKEYFDFLLREYHMVPRTGEEIEKIGLKYIDDTIGELKELTAEIDPGKEWIEVIDDVKSDVPPARDLLEYYRREILSTKKFVFENDLVSIPEGESLDVIETPSIHRATYPYAAYMMPAPFEKDQRGLFWVTPVDENGPKEKAEEQLSGHSKAAITVRTLHEGYPGHHLQFCHANRVASKVRRIFSTSVFAEGWALYCEELMKKKGYYTDVRARIIQLKDQLWRACRVVIDVRLHTGRCTFDEAVDMLVNIARLERHNAIAEVKRYSQTPTQPMSYLIGKIEIERLAGHAGEKFRDISLKEFHDRLLSFGTIPVALIHDAMLGTK